MKNLILIFTILTIHFEGYSQDSEKMNKNLKVFIKTQIEPGSSFSFDRTNPEKHGWDKVSVDLENAFVSHGLVVSKAASKYTIMVDYDYKYAIYAYRMQCSNLKAQIINSDNKQIIGTIAYNGKFEIKDISDAIAGVLSKK